MRRNFRYLTFITIKRLRRPGEKRMNSTLNRAVCRLKKRMTWRQESDTVGSRRTQLGRWLCERSDAKWCGKEILAGRVRSFEAHAVSNKTRLGAPEGSSAWRLSPFGNVERGLRGNNSFFLETYLEEKGGSACAGGRRGRNPLNCNAFSSQVVGGCCCRWHGCCGTIRSDCCALRMILRFRDTLEV